MAEVLRLKMEAHPTTGRGGLNVDIMDALPIMVCACQALTHGPEPESRRIPCAVLEIALFRISAPETPTAMEIPADSVLVPP